MTYELWLAELLSCGSDQLAHGPSTRGLLELPKVAQLHKHRLPRVTWCWQASDECHLFARCPRTRCQCQGHQKYLHGQQSLQSEDHTPFHRQQPDFPLPEEMSKALLL